MRPSILLSFWRVHKCRRHVLRSLEGFTARWRAQGRPASQWEDPTVLGFLVTLVTRLAERAVGPLDGDALGDLQSELWGTLTGLPRDLLGERVALLSAAQDPRFVEGCRRALTFAAALEAGDAAADETGELGGESALARVAGRQALSDLWDRLLLDTTPA